MLCAPLGVNSRRRRFSRNFRCDQYRGFPLLTRELELPTAFFPWYGVEFRRPLKPSMLRTPKSRTRLCALACGFIVTVCATVWGETFKNPPLVTTGSDPTSLSFGDFNADGKPDLVYGDPAGLHILLGNGDGTFKQGQFISMPSGLVLTITVADVNGDGKLDLLFGANNPQPTVNVLLGNGDGTFGPIITSTWFLNLPLYALTNRRMGVADFNQDGAADVVVSDPQNDQMYVLLGNNTGTFTLGSVIPENSSPRDVLIGDFNGDGKEDFLVQGGLGADVRLFLGNGDGTFQTPVIYGGTSSLGIESVVLADVDGDGHVDMVVSTQASTVEILHGNTDGTFTATTGGATLNSYAVVLGVADFNSDGIPDIAVDDGSGINILLGTGNLNYATPVPYSIGTSSWACVFADFNSDGHPDMAITAPGGIALLFGTANGALQSFAVYDVGQPVSAIASADFNGDRIADIVVAEGSAGPGILIGKGDGTFTLEGNTAVTGGTGIIALTGDFNGDGKADLYFTGINSSGVVLFGNGNGTFGPPVDLTQFQQVGFVAAGAADFNNDRRTDLVSLNYQSSDVLLGQANETFQLLTSSLPGLQSNIAPAIGDFNRDGNQDMIVAGLTTVQVLLGKGDGTFTLGRSININLPGSNLLCTADALATADLDGDGNLDVVIPMSCANVAEILYGNGDGTFQDPVQLPLEQGYGAVSIADLNGDNLPDLIFSNGGMIAIIHGAGNRTFSGETHYLTGIIGNLVVKDFNGDGFPDIGIASSGTTVSVLLNQPSGALTSGILTVQPEPSTFTKPFTTTVTITPVNSGATPTGVVTFAVDDLAVGTASLKGGEATFTYHSASLQAGPHAVNAIYSGDANFVSSSFTVQHQIIPIVYPTSIILTGTPTTVLAGQTVSFQTNVTSSPGQTPYGTVSFLDGTAPMGSMLLDGNSSAVFDTSLLSPGKHSITAYFVGNQDFAPVTSSPVSVTVNVNQTATNLTTNPTAVSVGASVVLTATVASAAGTPTGSVVFYDGTSLMQNTSLDATGTAVYGTTFSTAGTHVISASYVANASFAASSSSTVNVIVTGSAAAKATRTSLSAVVSSSIARAFSLIAHVKRSNGPQSGSVIFLDGKSTLGTRVLDDTGTAIYDSVSLGAGTHYLSAYFPGTSTANGSVSPVVAEIIPGEIADFSMTASPASVVVGASAPSKVRLNVKAINGFGQAVTLTCSTGAPSLTCAVQPAVMTGGSIQSTLSLATAASNGDLIASVQNRTFPTLMGLLVTPVLLLSVFPRRSRRSGRLVLAIFLCAVTLGCGSTLLTPEASRVFVVTVTGTSQNPGPAVVHTVTVQAQISGDALR